MDECAPLPSAQAFISRKRRKQASLDRLRAEHQRYHQEVSSIRFPSAVPRPGSDISSSSSSSQAEDDEKAAVWDSVETLKVPPLPARVANPVEAWDCFPQSGTTTSRRTEEAPAGIRITAKTLLTANRGEVRVDRPVAGTPRITTGSPRTTLPLKSSTPRAASAGENARPPLQLPPGEIVLASSSMDILVGDTVTAAKPPLAQQPTKTLSYVPHTLEDAPSKVPSLGRKTQDSSSASKSTETSASRRLTSKIKGILKKLDSAGPVHVECSVFKNLPNVKTSEAVGLPEAQAYLQDVVRALRAKEAMPVERQASPSAPLSVGELINRYMALSESKKPAGDAGVEEKEERVINAVADAAGEHMKMNAGSQSSLDEDRTGTLSCKQIQCSFQADQDKLDKCTQSSPVNADQGHRHELTELKFAHDRVKDAAQVPGSRKLDPHEKLITRRARQGDEFLERCREKIGGLLERCRSLEIFAKDRPRSSIRVKDHPNRGTFKGKENKNLTVDENHARAVASLAGDIHSTFQHRSRSLHQRNENAPVEPDAWQKLESRFASVKSAVRNATGETLDYDQIYKELADLERERTQIERERTQIEQRDRVRFHLRVPHDQQEIKKANPGQRTKRPRNTRSPGREPGSKLLRSSVGRIEPHISSASRDPSSSRAPEKQSEALKSVLRRPQRPPEVLVTVRTHAASKERMPAWVKRMTEHKPKLDILEHPERARSDKSKVTVTVKRRSLRPPESIFRAGKSITWLADGPNDGEFIPTSEESKRVGDSRQAPGKTAAVRSDVSAYYGFPSTSVAHVPEQTGELKVGKSVAPTTVPQISGARREDESGTRIRVDTRKTIGPKEGKPGWVVVGDYCISEFERTGGRGVHAESDKQSARALPSRPTMERPQAGHRLVHTEDELLEQSLLEALLSDLVQGEQATHRDEMLPLLQSANLTETDERIAPATTAYLPDFRSIHRAPGWDVDVDAGCQTDFKDSAAPTYAGETSGVMVCSGYSEGRTRPVASAEEVPLLSAIAYSDKEHTSTVACQTEDAFERQFPVLVGGHAPGKRLHLVSALRTTTASQTELLLMHQAIDRPPPAATGGCQTTEATVAITISSVADRESDVTEPLLPHRAGFPEPLSGQQLQRSQLSSSALLTQPQELQEERPRLRPLRTVRHDAETQTRREATLEKEIQAVTESSTTSPSTPSTPVSSPECQARLEAALAPLRPPGTRNGALLKLLPSGTMGGEQPQSSETGPFLELEERRPLLETAADVIGRLRPPDAKDGGSASACRSFIDRVGQAQDVSGEAHGGDLGEVPGKEVGTAPRNLERDVSSEAGRQPGLSSQVATEKVAEETQPLSRDSNTQPAEVAATGRQSPTRQHVGRPVTVPDRVHGAASAASGARPLPSPLAGPRLSGPAAAIQQFGGPAEEEVVEKPEKPPEKDKGTVLASRGFVDRILQVQDSLRRNLGEVPGEEARIAPTKLERVLQAGETSEAGTQAGTRNQIATEKLAEETQPLLRDSSTQSPGNVVATGKNLGGPGTMQEQLESIQPPAEVGVACRQAIRQHFAGPAAVRFGGPAAVEEEAAEESRIGAQKNPAQRGESVEEQAPAEVAATPRLASTREHFGGPAKVHQQLGGPAVPEESAEDLGTGAHQAPARRRERVQEPESSVRVQRNITEAPGGQHWVTDRAEEAVITQEKGQPSAMGADAATVRLLRDFDIQATGVQFLLPSETQPRLLGAAGNLPAQVAGFASLKDTDVGARLAGTSPPQLGSTSQLTVPQAGSKFQLQLQRGPRGRRYPLLFGRQVFPAGQLKQLAELERKAAAALRGKLPPSPSALPGFQMSPSLPLSSSHSRLYDTREVEVARLVLESDSTSTSTSSEEESTSSSSTSSGICQLPVHLSDECPLSFRQISEGEVEAGGVPGYEVQASEGEIALGE